MRSFEIPAELLVNAVKHVSPRQTSRHTIADWLNYCREIIFIDLDEKMMPRDGDKIGGPNIHVEIDEAKIGRRKHNKGNYTVSPYPSQVAALQGWAVCQLKMHDFVQGYSECMYQKLRRTLGFAIFIAGISSSEYFHYSIVFISGRLVDGHWILGLIEIQTGEEGRKRRGGRFRLEILLENSKSEETLLRLIKKHVLPGTTIITDGWNGYKNLADHGFVHYTVIHEYNFVDPAPGANTQTIESNWRPVRRVLQRGGITHDTFHLHLAEYLWRRELLISGEDPFRRFLSAAAYVYNSEKATAEYNG